MTLVAEAETVAPTTVDPAALPREDLLSFVESSTLELVVKETSRLKVVEPDNTFEEVASRLVASGLVTTCHTSTAGRKYKKFETAAQEAGFTVPPRPDLAAERGQYEQPPIRHLIARGLERSEDA
ncbi:MAG: hypothetical protein WAW17_26190 [Rhodococcus sp. (in: high G+C Gram-positive bacteria)]|uniref:hypothetical protein n=1 Tax=Rhodococcus sp. TaxID=1831 RepID=UPI003BB0E2C4